MRIAISISAPDGLLDAEAIVPPQATEMLVLAHGAGAPFNHATMVAIAQAMAQRRIATLRFNFPYMQQGRKRTDSKAVAVTAMAAAVLEAQRRYDLPIFAGGHSFGGRMASHMVAEKAAEVRGLVFCSFPLHASKKPSVTRAAHLPDIDVPMLFLSGTRDTLAERELLRNTVHGLKARAQLHWLETADHGYKILRRARIEPPTVFDEMAAVTRRFMDQAQHPT